MSTPARSLCQVVVAAGLVSAVWLGACSSETAKFETPVSCINGEHVGESGETYTRSEEHDCAWVDSDGKVVAATTPDGQPDD